MASGKVKLIPFSCLAQEQISAVADFDARLVQRSSGRDDAPWSAETLLSSLAGTRSLSWVARVDDEIVGYLVASQGADDEVRLHRLRADLERGGLGIGAALVARLLETTAAAISLSCQPDNHTALDLYRSFGFVTEKTLVDQQVVLRLAARHGVRSWYIYNTTSMAIGHASHIPRLLEAMAQYGSVVGVGYGTEELPAFRWSVAWARAFGRLLRRARSERVRVIFVRIHWRLAGLLAVAGRVLGWRVVVWSSGAVGIPTQLEPEVPVGGGRAQRALFAFVLRHVVDAVATGPARVADEYARRYRLARTKVLVVANDVDVAWWSGASANDIDIERSASPCPAGTAPWFDAPYRLLYAHGLDDMRGGDRLPGLMSAISDHLPGVLLLAVGHGTAPATLVADPHILAPGAVSNDDVAVLMRHAHAVLVPSRQEGFPRVVVEALAAGCPPVCTDVGGCRDIVGPALAGRLVSDSLDGMADLVVALCTAHADDDGLRDALVARAQEFDTPVVARRLVAALTLLGVSGPPAAHHLSTSGWHEVFVSAA
jgi:glycosyltransferase involved in cell wall biosynthesis